MAYIEMDKSVVEDVVDEMGLVGEIVVYTNKRCIVKCDDKNDAAQLVKFIKEGFKPRNVQVRKGCKTDYHYVQCLF